MVDHLDYLVSAAALILFDQESPSPLTCLNNCVYLNHRDSRFFLATSANHHRRTANRLA